ncbi:MAG: monodechloroaminopyrrolnitrin synthase PrnB family protein, partial [Hyphococcus sp.]
SGPPLEVLLRSLEVLRDMRLAARRDDIRTSWKEMETLKKAAGV